MHTVVGRGAHIVGHSLECPLSEVPLYIDDYIIPA